MKNILYITAILTTLSCNGQIKQDDKTIVETIIKTDNSKHHTTKDTILITTEINENLKYSKADFNNIVDNHPEFFEKFPNNPDLTYFSNNKWFGESEVGQDDYYIMYAYFIKQINGDKEFAKQRQKLIDIYSNINSLFSHFEYGGTYFTHQYKRILGYVEYSIYLLPKNKEEIEKTYDITLQKKLYIKTLRQLINDESKIDYYTFGKVKKLKHTKELNKIVDNLEKLITNNFYLRRAQEFHYSHYEYY